MSKRTIVKDASYTAKDIDMVSIIIFNSGTDCTLTLPSPTGLIYADCDIHNVGAGTVTIGTQTVATGSHAHISNDGMAWVVVIGSSGDGEETDPVFAASAAAGIESADITQWNVAQKNSDITKAEIEAKLTGEISSHYHRTKPQQWKNYPDSPEEAKAFPYQVIEDYDGEEWLHAYTKEVYAGSLVSSVECWWELVNGGWVQDGEPYLSGTSNAYVRYIVASNFDIYSDSSKTALVYARQNDDKSILVGETIYYEPLVNGDPDNPEIMFDDSGDIIMVEV